MPTNVLTLCSTLPPLSAFPSIFSYSQFFEISTVFFVRQNEEIIGKESRDNFLRVFLLFALFIKNFSLINEENSTIIFFWLLRRLCKYFRGVQGW